MLKIVLFSLLILIFSVNNLFAHQPNSMNIKYDSKKEVLSINIFHNTPNGQLHYIKRIVIYKNDIQQELLSFSLQEDLSNVELEFDIKAGVGDNMRVEAYCKNGGILKQTLVVSK